MCAGKEPATATWQVMMMEFNCPGPECPQDCDPACLPKPQLGCFCRTPQPMESILCNYSHCDTAKTVEQVVCPGSPPGGKSIWTAKGYPMCCDQADPNKCPGCTDYKDVMGQPVSFCQ
jgi:hypothetical protein